MLKYFTLEELFLIIICFISRVLFLSCSLDDWDHINFAMALDDFGPTYARPHMPGYTVYVFLAWSIYLITKNHILSLTMVNAITSTLTVLPIYRLTNKFFDKKDLAILASFLFIVSPLIWIHSVIGLSDICNVFFLSLASYWLYLGIEEKKKFYLGTLTLALAAGVRPTDLVFCIFLPFVILARTYKTGHGENTTLMKEAGVFLKGTIIFVITFLLWFLPTIYFSDGWSRYFSRLSRKYEGVNSKFGIFPDRKATLYEIISKSKAIYQALFRDGFGMGYLEDSYIFITLPIILIGFVFYLLKSDITDRKNQFLLLWFITYFAWDFPVLMTVDHTRYLLPIIVPFFLMFIWGIKTPFEYFANHFRKEEKILKILLVAPLLLGMFLQGVYSAHGLHTIPSPYTQIVEYVQLNYSPDETLIIVAGERNHFEFLAPEFELHHNKFVSSDSTSKKIILVTKTAIKSGHVFEEDCQLIKEFSRHSRIYSKNSFTALYLYVGS